MTSPETRRVLLRRDVDADRILLVGNRLAWIWQDRFESTDEEPLEIVWVTSEGDNEIRFVEDFVADATYLTISGPGSERVLSEVANAIGVETFEEALAELEDARSPSERVRLLLRVAIAAPSSPSSEGRSVFDRSFSDPDPEVRRGAILAAGYVGWRDLKRSLEHLVQTEADEAVRSDAARMLQGFELRERGELP